MHDEEVFAGAVRKFLSNFLSLPVIKKPKLNYGACVVGNELLPLLIAQFKRLFGVVGDACLQGFVVFAKTVSAYRDRSNLPTVLLSVMGNLVEIAGALFTDGVHTTTFFSQKINLSGDVDKVIRRLTGVFEALRICLLDLQRKRSELALLDPPGHAHLFPSPLAAPTCDDYEQLVTSHLVFTYRMRGNGTTFPLAKTLEDRLSKVYLATLPQQEAHQSLAQLGYAPKLIACVSVCDEGGTTETVIMQRLAEQSAFTATYNSPETRLPHTVYEDVEGAIKHLHRMGVAFGDLRAPNIMVVPTATRTRGVLIDFDWADKFESAVYPITPNNDILLHEMPPGVCANGPITKEHDDALLEKLKAVCEPM
ncbi:hypothetical protein C8Q80DRAFT_1265491 [Daedaleopsis nitida]|nr:hypothetical protein C8Q80DRAFT_1265491 [Daedaleopsis nitida]